MPIAPCEADDYFTQVQERWQDSPMQPLYEQRKNLLLSSQHFHCFLAARKIYWETHDEKFQIQYDPEERRKRRAQTTSSYKTAMFFLQTCHAMMNEIMYESPIMWQRRFHHVLDLCSAPGGFCKALLERFNDARIDAYTLHPEDGGSPMLTKHKRLNSQYENVIDLSINQSFRRLIRYDMVILGGAWASYVDNIDPDQESDSSVFYPNLKLKLAELHIMLQCIRPNGVAIVKLPLKFENVTGTIIWILLEKVFKTVEPFRPSCNSCSSLWSHSFVYMICSGIRSAEIREEYTHKVKTYLAMCMESRADFIDEFIREDKILQEILCKEEKIWDAMSQAYIQKLRQLEQS